MRSVAENTEPGQAIGDPVTATDPEGNTLTYSLGGTDADAFGIDEANGQLRTSAALDYETRSSYSVTVVAKTVRVPALPSRSHFGDEDRTSRPRSTPPTTCAAWPRTPNRGRPSETR